MLTAKMINVLLSNGLKLQTCRVSFAGQKGLFSEISCYIVKLNIYQPVIGQVCNFIILKQAI